MIVGLLAGLTGVAIGLAAWKANDYGNNVDRLTDALPSGDRPDAAPGSALTFLIVGVDPADKNGRSVAASLLLARVTGDRKAVQLVSLPPGMGGGGAGTRSHPEPVLDAGGVGRVVGAVESATGILIDHVGMLDFPAFKTMTNALGGVYLDVPAPYENGGHVFSVGLRRLDGTEALAYVRNRDDGARSSQPLRQQRMLEALFERVTSQGAFSDLGRLNVLVEALTRSLRVDDTLDTPALVSLAWEVRGVGSPSFVSAPTDDRADALWTYLRSDSLAAHLDEFR